MGENIEWFQPGQDELSRLRAKLKAAEEALEPFASIAPCYDHFAPHHRMCINADDGVTAFLLGAAGNQFPKRVSESDFRRARTALEKIRG